MRRSLVVKLSALGGLALLGFAAAGCGQDRTQRGLSPANEEANPASQQQLGETTKERHEEVTEEMQQQRDAAVDAESGEKAK
ncbi:MAG TPA: hypothetical protein VMW35_05465 [Myxococcota bacterium]|jgi:hypothetical protein|nr:hypothetical protein [Myxococcota bacterium]